MSFGRKGLPTGHVAPSAGANGIGGASNALEGFAGSSLHQGGQGGPPPPAERASAPKSTSSGSAEKPINPDEMAARRQAFIASERARRAEAEAIPTKAPKPAAVVPIDDDPLINLRNMSRPEPRPARPMGDGVNTQGAGGSNEMSAQQEAEIRSSARGMARNQSMRYGADAIGSGVGGGGRGLSSGGGAKAGSGYIFGDPATRNVGLAYVLWFVLGQFSVHRFYCGQKDSAIMQVGLWFGSLVMIFIFMPMGLVGVLFWMCWIVGDLFMIPGMLAKFKAEHDYRGVFA
ncbi:NINE protein [Erythrobacter sp. Alg231-14]|uniref:NINE protein n=1 Tax=Erythrobacter sp. Alg231-14 TaxID=1922225 RepID=UPI000D559795